MNSGKFTIMSGSSQIVLLVALTSMGCLASSVNQMKVDTYVDNVIADANKQLLDNSLEPLPLKAFTFKIGSTGILNRDVKANITLGRFEGLSKLHRRRPCSLSVPEPVKGRPDLAPAANITISCNVTFSGVKVLVINGEYKGDSLAGTLKNFSTVTNIDTADMNITLVGRPGLTGHLTLTVLEKVVLTTSFATAEDKPNLNKERLSNFTDELNRKLAAQLFDFAGDRYKKFVDNAISRRVLPYLV